MIPTCIEVAAGLVFHQGKLLITRRRPEDHLGGLWEFPGGKRELGESFEACLHRELHEELGIEVAVGKLIEIVRHDYPERSVLIHFYQCEWRRHEAQPIGCAEIAWLNRQDLARYEFPAADQEILKILATQLEVWINASPPQHQPAAPPPLPRPLRLNQKGYRGERIDPWAVLDQCRGALAAREKSWRIECLGTETEDGIWVLTHAHSNPDSSLRAYISAGIHGDEPAGPLAILELLRSGGVPDSMQLWLCPCLNPSGMKLGQRENRAGQDLNRDYLHERSDETRRHIDWLTRQPSFDVTLCLHEDWEANGFYLYELNPDGRPSAAESAIAAAGLVCPIDNSETIDGRAASGGIIRPELDPDKRSEWPEAYYLLQHKTRLSYTLEAPSDFDLPVRVQALVDATREILRHVAR